MAGEVLQSERIDTTIGNVRLVMRRNYRRQQQDAALIDGALVVVADGMGGHADGDVASRTAVEAFADAWRQHPDLQAAAEAADDAVRGLAEVPAPRAPATTLVAVHLDGSGVAHGIWSGDSRAYLLGTDGSARQLTDDHTDTFGGLLGFLGDAYPDINELLVETFTVDLNGTAGLLLCTDGLTGPFDRDPEHGDTAVAIGALLHDQGLTALVDAAEDNGTDNITAALIATT